MPKIVQKTKNSLLEEVSDKVHNVWMNWMEYFLKQSCHSRQAATIEINVDIKTWNRWMRQMKTPYEDLPENEKESDRKIAQKYIKIIQKTP